MIARVAAVSALGVLLGAPAWAQDQKFSIGVDAGWTISDGVTGDARQAGDGSIYNEIGPTDSFSWGGSLGYMFGEHSEVGFLYEQQESTLEISGTAVREIADIVIRNYHGIFAYNFGAGEAAVRPFLFFGLGATSYPGLEFTRADGRDDEIGGSTKFSPTLGLGLKMYPGRSVGLRLQARWTPTNVKSDAAGYWCDPYWGCYVAEDAQYSNQFAFTGGVSFRF